MIKIINKIIWRKQGKNKKDNKTEKTTKAIKCLTCNNKMLDFMVKCWMIKMNNNIKMKKTNNKNKI